MDNAPSKGTASAVRLTFEYEGENVRMVSSQKLDMLVPRSDPLAGYQAEHGSWIELRDGEDRPIYRVILRGAIQADVEAPSDEPAHHMTRRVVDRPKGVFVVLLPNLSEAKTVALWHNVKGPKDTIGTMRMLLHIPFPRQF